MEIGIAKYISPISAFISALIYIFVELYRENTKYKRNRKTEEPKEYIHYANTEGEKRIREFFKDYNRNIERTSFDELQKNIKCKVCDKEIPYNDLGTCTECHNKIINRLNNKRTKD